MNPQLIIANDRALNDSLNLSLLYGGPQGLMEPAIVSRGTVIDTFGGPIRVAGQADHFEPRRMRFSGLIGAPGGNADGQFDLYQRAHDAFRTIQGRPARIQVGSLVLDAAFGQLSFSGITDNPRVLGWTLDAEAVPATFGALYGYAVGAGQGIPVVDDRRDRAELRFGSGGNAMVDINGYGQVFTVFNPGSAPCDLPLLVSGLVEETTYYLANRDPAAGAPVVFSTGEGQTTYYLSPAYGVKSLPGTNVYQLQTDAAGTLATGTYKWAVAGYPAPWRFLGNSAGRFGDSPAIPHHFRRGTATAITAAAGTSLTVRNDVAARIGLPSGCAPGSSLSAALTSSQGLILEQASTNVCLQSEDFQTTWSPTYVTITPNDAVAPDGSQTADKIDDPYPGNTCRVEQAVTIATDSSWWAASVFLKKDSTTSRFPELELRLTGSSMVDIAGRINTQTGETYQSASTGAGAVKAYDAGDYWRLVVTAKNNGSGNVTATVYVYPARSTTLNGAATDSATGYIHAWGAQLENLPFASTYTRTTDSSASRAPDYAALHLPHNYLRHSHDLTRNVLQTTDSSPASDLSRWVRRGATPLTVARNGSTADGTTTGSTLTFGASGDSIFQRVVPDCRPSASAWTFVVTVRKTAGSPTSASLKLKTDESGQTGTGKYADYTTTVGTATIPFSEFPDTTTSRTFFLTATPGSSATDFIVEIGASGSGNFVVEHSGVLKGGLPALFPLTESASLLLPRAGWQWLASITQNGCIQWKAVLPPLSGGLLYYLLGESGSNTLALYREAATGTETGGSKANPGNTATSLSGISGSPAPGTYVLRVVKDANGFSWYWNGTPCAGNPFPAWGGFFGGYGGSITNATAGTITVADSASPPNGGANGTYDDNVTVTGPNMLRVARRAATIRSTGRRQLKLPTGRHPRSHKNRH
ncbi:MAG: hypothetical protein FJZ01_25820 [Candidatus Sericytochromatia bacterium]|nr:hypothetical protein [Candidatus Tanganyikabacteria bacterium]